MTHATHRCIPHDSTSPASPAPSSNTEPSCAAARLQSGFVPPRTVELYDLSCSNPTSNSLKPAIRFLLDDLSAALDAYARVSASSVPLFVRSWDRSAKRADAAAPRSCVLGLDERSFLRSWTHLPCDGARIVYALVLAADRTVDERAIDRGIKALENACCTDAILWGGALVLRGGDAVWHTRHDPRMGRTREKHSLAIDQLVGAVRLGMTIAQAARLNEGAQKSVPANRIDADAPLGKLRHRMLLHKIERPSS